jgi:hypothetical protein
LCTGPADRDALTNQESFRRLCHVGRELGPVKCFQFASLSLKMGMKKAPCICKVLFMFSSYLSSHNVDIRPRIISLASPNIVSIYM